MGKIVSFDEVSFTTEGLHEHNKRIVLVGGCFDILHAGHVVFLEKAKEHGDFLVLFLESDVSIKKTKGNNRPINVQQNRAIVLAALSAVDLVVLLPEIMTDQLYDGLVLQIKPAIIATTAGDPNRHHKDRQAKRIGATVIEVTDRLSEHATSTVVATLAELYE